MKKFLFIEEILDTVDAIVVPSLNRIALDHDQFHQHCTHSFYTQRSQKRKKDSQLKQLFAHSGSAGIKSARKYIDEIDPRNEFENNLFRNTLDEMMKDLKSHCESMRYLCQTLSVTSEALELLQQLKTKGKT